MSYSSHNKTADCQICVDLILVYTTIKKFNLSILIKL